MGDGFYRSKDPTNSIKVLKEQRKYKTEDKLNIQTIKKLNTTQKKQNKTTLV